MLLRNTKKFLQKTLQSLKSLFSGDNYQKLPKTYCSPFSINDQIDLNAQRSFNTNRTINNVPLSPSSSKHNKKIITTQHSSNDQHHQVSVSSSTNSIKNYTYNNTTVKNISPNQGTRPKRPNHEDRNVVDLKNRREDGEAKRVLFVAEKLKEIERIDIHNMDHVLDVEEVFHYYSRLTCPAYVDIVEKFFMDVYSDFFGNYNVDSMEIATPLSVSSRPIRVRSLKTRS